MYLFYSVCECFTCRSYGAHAGQKRLSYPLKLELWMVVGHHVGTEPGSFTKALNLRFISPILETSLSLKTCLFYRLMESSEMLPGKHLPWADHIQSTFSIFPNLPHPSQTLTITILFFDQRLSTSIHENMWYLYSYVWIFSFNLISFLSINFATDDRISFFFGTD